MLKAQNPRTASSSESQTRALGALGTHTHHLFIGGEAHSDPAVGVRAHLVLHVGADAPVAQEVVARLCIAARLPVPAGRKRFKGGMGDLYGSIWVI